MKRRTVLVALVGATTGCLGGRAPGESRFPESDAEATTETATGTTATTSATTTAGTTREPCTAVETEFEVPTVEKPDSLSAAVAQDVAFDVERAYGETLTAGSETLEEVPDDVDSFTLSLQRATATSFREGFRVTVEAMARYGYDGEEAEETQFHADRPLDVATYEVTDRKVRRVSGRGDLTGTLVCW